MITAWLLFGMVLVNLTVALTVYLTNPRRGANRAFLILGMHMGLWSASSLFLVSASSLRETEMWLRTFFGLAAFFPTSFTILYQAVKLDADRLTEPAVRSRLLAFTGVVAAVAAFHPAFLSLLHPREASELPPDGVRFGPLFVFYGLYLVLSGIVGILCFLRDNRRTQGIRRTEIQYVAAGFASAFAIGITTVIFIPYLSGRPQGVLWGPVVASAALSLVVAYGIATTNIMDVSQLMRRIFGYALLLLSLSGLYALVHLVVALLQSRTGSDALWLPAFVAVLVVAASMTPAQGIMRRLARRLLISPREVNISRAMAAAGEVMSPVSTVDRLLLRFANVIHEYFAASHVAILIRKGNGFAQVQPSQPRGGRPLLYLPASDPLIRHLQSSGSIVSRPTLRRRGSDDRAVLLAKLTMLKAELAGGISVRGRLQGILLVGPRPGGAVFTRLERVAFQLLLGQLGIALENALLYTEVQNSKIYNEILLEHLPSGVIAADKAGRITVCNREACRILNVQRNTVLGRALTAIPQPLHALMDDVIRSGREVRDKEIVLPAGGTETPLRVGGARVHNDRGRLLGTIFTLSDLSRVKELEQQVRRSDRLASVGTLSAGMAHEIKNPLVAIKTFAQLLPERYNEPDFRETFSQLLQKEVERIDDIVTQLLNFARPRKVASELCHLHEVIRRSLKLIQQQVEKRNISLECRLDAPRDAIRGDHALLEQTFLNFFINAMEAMNHRGSLSVTSDLLEDPGHDHDPSHIRVRVQDSGQGIAPEHIERIFDPFFTTKENGTGLGLSVAHEIIEEHGGSVEVSSRLGQGTTFTLVFPLAEQCIAPGPDQDEC
ncbi:MAG TPA: PAS domain-containing protein [Kiritimatiellae bacterium]|nr:PAS domain-containing protein [Kiritimatiellia bacterium]